MRHCRFHALFWCTVSTALLAAPLSVTVDTTTPQWTISPYLVGLHQVYTFTPDAAFADGSFAAWARRAGVSFSRYPGGTVVKYWDWENPTGQAFIDAMDPDFDPAENPPASEWMSLDEYLVFIEASGIEPIFGVNSLNGERYDREAEGIARAARMVAYVKERGHGAGYWYIGNEEAFEHGGIVDYAKVFRRYAEAMKAEDPAIRIFWNDNDASSSRIQDFLNNDGGTADGLETHGKWPFGGDPGLPAGTFEEWLEEVPLRDRKNGNRAAGGRAWRFAANTYRNAAASVGRDLLIANNEYGIGKGSSFLGFNRYTTGLLLSEMILEHFIGDWFSTSFWDLTRGTETGLLDKPNGYRRNPAALGMNLLADAQGGEYLQTLSTDLTSVHGFAAKREGVVLVYLLNKTPAAHDISITLSGESFDSGYARRMQNSADGYGELVHVPVAANGVGFTANLPSLTLTEFVFVPAGTRPRFGEPSLSGSEILLRWSSLPGLPLDLEKSTNLDAWVPLESDIQPDNLWTERTLPLAPETRTFYRVEWKPIRP